MGSARIFAVGDSVGAEPGIGAATERTCMSFLGICIYL